MFKSRFVHLAFLSLFLAFPASAEEETKSVNEPVEAVVVAPHRAIYKMTMGSIKNGSEVSKVNGRMFFEWANTCDGWAVQQKLQLHFFYKEGTQSDIDSTVVTWESKDAKNFTFNVRRLTDGKETENYRGKATASGDTGEAVYTTPKDKKTALKDGTLFPSSHTIMIIQKAMEGKRLFIKPVFDGSDEIGFSDVSAFIGEKKADVAPSSLANNALLKGIPAWPVRLAFFKPESQTGEPDYEMNLTLLQNGVAQSMQIDYNDFSVNGVLEEIEPLPEPGC